MLRTVVRLETRFQELLKAAGRPPPLHFVHAGLPFAVRFSRLELHNMLLEAFPEAFSDAERFGIYIDHPLFAPEMDKIISSILAAPPAERDARFRTIFASDIGWQSLMTVLAECGTADELMVRMERGSCGECPFLLMLRSFCAQTIFETLLPHFKRLEPPDEYRRLLASAHPRVLLFLLRESPHALAEFGFDDMAHTREFSDALDRNVLSQDCFVRLIESLPKEAVAQIRVPVWCTYEGSTCANAAAQSHVRVTHAQAIELVKSGCNEVLWGHCTRNCFPTPLSRTPGFKIAVQLGLHDVAKKFLDVGVDVNGVDEEGRSPLHHLGCVYPAAEDPWLKPRSRGQWRPDASDVSRSL